MHISSVSLVHFRHISDIMNVSGIYEAFLRLNLEISKDQGRAELGQAQLKLELKTWC